MPDYAITVFWSDEDGQWIAAKELWLEVAQQDDEEIPEPRYRPVPSPR